VILQLGGWEWGYQLLTVKNKKIRALVNTVTIEPIYKSKR
jgi:hypothetical protein